MAIDFRDLQGLVPRLYRYPLARYILFRFSDAGPAREFLARTIPRVTTAAQTLDGRPEPLWNLALTAAGLAATGLDPRLLDRLESAFLEGPDGVSLGDFGDSAPQTWWEGRIPAGDIHGLILITALTDQTLEDATGTLREDFGRFGLAELPARVDGRPLEGRTLGGGRLHFGYTDGISHPDVRWGDETEVPGTVDFRNFLLGYANSRYPSAPAAGPAADLVRGSSYAVFRVIYQDVARFEQFLSENAGRMDGGLPVDRARELLAAKMLGRWRDGTPLALSPDRPDATLSRSDAFSYAADPEGRSCPFSAHIRVVNPRDQPLDVRITGSPGSEPPPFGPVPRVLRRGLPYGPELTGDQDDQEDRGLIGLFLVASIRFQIYTLTRWMKANNFSPVFQGRTNAQDALFANRSTPGAASDFLIPKASGAALIPGLPDFVRTRGTVFLLLPSLPTLRALARLG